MAAHEIAALLAALSAGPILMAIVQHILKKRSEKLARQNENEDSQKADFKSRILNMERDHAREIEKWQGIANDLRKTAEQYAKEIAELKIEHAKAVQSLMLATEWIKQTSPEQVGVLSILKKAAGE